ncbi:MULTISPECIES: hypothetical protein [Actinosynnema]|uniref:hypothetical protein n=1 Tax=Actinosynnema TaxID=40566 RepID=UPI0020A482D5|nr:hypothetical protein [Actinosynnema pretiosum]
MITAARRPPKERRDGTTAGRDGGGAAHLGQRLAGPRPRPDGSGRVGAGGWRLAAGGWRLAAGGWRLAAGG